MNDKVLMAGLDTPVGPVLVSESEQGISRVRWGSVHHNATTPLLDQAIEQLAEYFAGNRKQFELPLTYQCSDYQQQICEAMLEIPYGQTVTYGELATATKSSAQAVGNACGGNPYPIIVPCHRVLGANGLGGYSGDGGIETKIALLKMESDVPWLI